MLSAVGAAAALLTGCGDGHDQGMAHIHALAVDPADGALYAASHHGVFRIEPGKTPQRMGEGTQDTMGFAILGPRHFLGSGHPAPGDNQPGNLGLIESIDAGTTWQTVALSGQADFHAIEVKKNVTYGYDSQSQQIMVSSDRKNWERRADMQLADLAAAPENPDFLLATTAQGLAHSADGGRTFVLVTSAPTLQLIDWPAETAVIGVGPSGIVGASGDHGATWTRLGSVEGAPAALATNGPDEVYVATDRGIYASTDGGRNFTLRQRLASADN